jgi:hypothetical protein
MHDVSFNSSFHSTGCDFRHGGCCCPSHDTSSRAGVDDYCERMRSQIPGVWAGWRFHPAMYNYHEKPPDQVSQRIHGKLRTRYDSAAGTRRTVWPNWPYQKLRPSHGGVWRENADMLMDGTYRAAGKWSVLFQNMDL